MAATTTTVTTVDELDHLLVERLRHDGRESNRSLAAALGVNEATIAARLKRLAGSDVMRVVAVTDLHAFGVGCMGWVFIRVGERTPHEVAAAVAELPETMAVVVCSGRYGVVANVLATDTNTLAQLIADGIASVPGVAGVRCEVIVDVDRFETAWADLRFDRQLPVPPLGGDHTPLDIALVRALQIDARTSNRSIATSLGVSEATVRSRLRRLESSGAIRIQAVRDIESFGLSAHGVVTVRAAPGQMQQARALLSGLREFGFVARTLGSADFLGVVVADTRDHLLEVVMARVAGDPAISEIELYETAATLKHVHTWAQL